MKLSNVLRSGENPNKCGRQLIFYCPACESNHVVNIEGIDSMYPQWVFNGDVNKPTISPSVLVRWTEPSDKEEEFEDRTKDINKVCHFFIRNGKIEFCGDCTHKLSGQTVDMVEYYKD